MRVSTSLLSQFSLNSMLDQQKKLSDTQLQISTGKRVLAPSDDPYGSARTLDLEQTIKFNEQYKVNATYAENRLALMDGNLEGTSNALQRIRELTVNGANGTQTVESRKFISEEIEQLLNQILALSNAIDSNGEYIFAGYQGKTKPFEADGLGNFTYYGDDGDRYLKVGLSTSVSVGNSGEQTFVAIRNGNGTFQTADDTANQGTGIIDPGTVYGAYTADNYKIGFLPNLSTNVNDPVQYYVVDGQGNIIEPAAQAGMAEAVFTAGYLASTFGAIPYEDGAPIQGLDQLGIKTSISGTPAAENPPLRQDFFYITPSSNQSIFKTVQNIIDTLRGPQSSQADRAEFHNGMNRGLVDLDQAIGRILEIRSSIGARLNTVDKQLEINESFSLQMKSTLSDIQDLDFAEAITRMNLQLTGLQAAQNAYTRIQGLSLFNYIG